MPLSDRAISSLKPQETSKFVADAKGLYVRVHPTGTKTFVFRTRINGSARWIALGEYPVLTLAEARKKAALLAVSAQHGLRLFSDCYADWVKLISKTYKTTDRVLSRGKCHILPALGHKPIARITRNELSDLLTNIAATSPVSANRVFSDLRLMFGYAVERGWIESSPMALITKRTAGGKEKSRDRTLTAPELRKLIEILLTDRFAPATRLALALLVTTGQRSGEVRGLHAGEIERVDGRLVWRIPGHRTKNGDTHVIVLGKLSAWLVRYAFKELGNVPFDGMESPALARAVSRMAFDPPFTPHDLRRTMATMMADSGTPPHVIEKCLNHKMVGVMAVYNRAEYAAEKTSAWRSWERRLLQIKRPPVEGA